MIGDVIHTNYQSSISKWPRAKAQRRKDFLVFSDRKLGDKVLTFNFVLLIHKG